MPTYPIHPLLMTQRDLPRIPPLKALAAFEAVARNMSFTKAAAELNVTPSAISQQIKILEKHLSMRLFRRLNRRVLLTETGEIYHATVASAFSAIAEATDRIDTNLRPQILLVRSAPSFATKWLLPRLPDFLATNADLDIRLDASNEKTDFVRENVDLEIRFGRAEWGTLHVEPLCRERIIPLLSPELARRHSIQAPQDLASGVPLIHSVKCPVSWEMWFAAHEIGHTIPLRGPRFDRSYMSIDAAREGFGAALDSDILAHKELARGELVSPFTMTRQFVRTLYWLVCPYRNLEQDKTARFRQWLLSHPEMQSRESGGLCDDPGAATETIMADPSASLEETGQAPGRRRSGTELKLQSGRME